MFALEAYFKRIGFAGSRKPTVDTLKTLHLLHPFTIPFENLNPFSRTQVKLDMESLQNKLVLNNRGGYCFEQNLLFSEALTTLGFKVRKLAARVRWNVADEVITPRGHMLLLVNVGDEAFIADTGFGNLTLTAPLKFELNTEQQTPHEVFRIIQAGDEFLLQAKIGANWKSIYQFSLQEQFLPDYEVTNWYLSNFPASHFLNGIIIAKPFNEGRYILHNNQFSIYHLDGTTERTLIQNPDELQQIIKKVFLIDFQWDEQSKQRLYNLIRPA
ncbi:MAG TPA: arylamine N-acetyltransferase [Sphingobacteriaceae bacterium]